uniref:SH3 domain-containing protein n=1 Tax=Panagrolaimus sp. JU765 TaxID=591449 RepID=A0AC34Q6U8_9BILA
MKFLGGDSFRVEVFPYGTPKISVTQRFNHEKKIILTLRWMYERTKSVSCLKAPYPLPFIVKSSSSSNQPIFSGELLTHTDTKFTINDVDQNDWIKVDAGQKGFVTLYTNKMLNDCFPKNADESWTDYYDNINQILGTKIAVAKPETLGKMIGEIGKIKALFLKMICSSNPIFF